MGIWNSCIRHLQDVLSFVMGGSSEPQVRLTAPAASEGEQNGSSKPEVHLTTPAASEGELGGSSEPQMYLTALAASEGEVGGSSEPQMYLTALAASEGEVGGSSEPQVYHTALVASEGELGGSSEPQVYLTAPAASEGELGGSSEPQVYLTAPAASEGEFGGSSEPQVYLTAPAASEGELAGASRWPHACAGSKSTVEGAESGTCSSVEQRIQHSVRHWSLVTEPDCMSPEEQVAAKIENRAVFEELQSHSQWGRFFRTFGYDTEIFPSEGELEVGDKFAEGGQAELFHAHVTWKDPALKEQDLRNGNEHVLKVFKKGTSLRQLQSQWPVGTLRYHAEVEERTKLGIHQNLRFHCYIWRGTLLENGRFAFLMSREEEDLRSIIDRNMLTNDPHSGPFSLEECERMIYDIAFGMNELHILDVVHRDLKASNVLMTKNYCGHYICFIADYECSMGVLGTGFFRAPEVLQAIKDKNIGPEIFTKEVDVYSYGMTCYEILTGKLPFEGHPINDHDLVLNGRRPEVPEYVNHWMCDLVKWCWQPNPKDRPTFRDILKLLLTKSATIRELVALSISTN